MVAFIVSAVVGAIGGLIHGGSNGAQAANIVAHAEEVVAENQDLRRRLLGFDAQTNRNMRLTLTDEEFAEPMVFMANLVNNISAMDELRAKVNIGINLILQQQLPSQNELNKWLIWAIRLASKPAFVTHIEALLERGAQINHLDRDHRPISYAIYFCVPAAVQVLLEHDVNLQLYVKGKTILQYAKDRHESLEQGFVDINSPYGPNSLAALRVYQAASLEILHLLDAVINVTP